MADTYTITRSIGIDMGHRVFTHGSKCANIHGHRYEITAVCRATKLHKEGVQSDMVLDFGFLKGLMIDHIDYTCDHGMCLSVDDPWLDKFLHHENVTHLKQQLSGIKAQPHVLIHGIPGTQTKLVVVPFIPTAERLAEWWFGLMELEVDKCSRGLAQLQSIEVWETPNCSASFTPG